MPFATVDLGTFGGVGSRLARSFHREQERLKPQLRNSNRESRSSLEAKELGLQQSNNVNVQAPRQKALVKKTLSSDVAFCTEKTLVTSVAVIFARRGLPLLSHCRQNFQHPCRECHFPSTEQLSPANPATVQKARPLEPTNIAVSLQPSRLVDLSLFGSPTQNINRSFACRFCHNYASLFTFPSRRQRVFHFFTALSQRATCHSPH